MTNIHVGLIYSIGTTIYVSYPHISIIYAFPTLYLLNKLILAFNVVTIE